MTAREPQFSFALSTEEKRQLEDLATLLGKSKASVLKTAVKQLWDSVPERKRKALAAARKAVDRARDGR